MPRRITVDDARAQIERDRLANVARMPALKADAKTAAQDARAELEVRTAPKLPPETVFRFRKAVRFRVDVMPTALDTIRAELRNDVASGFHDGENGGLLLGRPTRHDIVVLEATGAGPAAIREPESITLDYFHGEQIAAQRGLEVIGAWHVHPGDGDDDVSTPSDNNLNAAACHLKTLSIDKRQIGWTFSELIVSAHLLDQ